MVSFGFPSVFWNLRKWMVQNILKLLCWSCFLCNWGTESLICILIHTCLHTFLFLCYIALGSKLSLHCTIVNHVIISALKIFCYWNREIWTISKLNFVFYPPYTVKKSLAALDAYPDISGSASGYIRILIHQTFPYIYGYISAYIRIFLAIF